MRYNENGYPTFQSVDWHKESFGKIQVLFPIWIIYTFINIHVSSYVTLNYNTFLYTQDS